MTDLDTLDRFGTLPEPTTLVMRRRLSGPPDRVWDYLTRADLRAKWLAAGDDVPAVGVDGPAAGDSFELVWRNATLTDPPGQKPEGFGPEHRMTSRVVTCDPPRLLVFTWGEAGEVRIDLTPADGATILTLTHLRIAERSGRLMIGAGWHAHLDILEARIAGTATPVFWDHWRALRADYDARIPH